MLNKKTQMEIMGLMIVVILIIIGMLFVVRFILVKKPAEFKAEFTQTQLASNILNAFLKTKTRDCHSMSITELLQDCGGSQIVYCDYGDSSCTYVENAANEIFGKTLDKWNYKYHFSVYFQGETPILTLGSECIGDKKSKEFPIPTGARSLYTKLDICR